MRDDLAAVIRGIAPVIKEYVGSVVDALGDRVATLERRLRDVEEKSVGPYLGIWADTTLYGKGQLVTCGGSMWIAKSASIARRPGTDSSWQLIVKKGSDGRAGKDA